MPTPPTGSITNNDYFFDDAAGNPAPCLPGNLPAGRAPAGSGCVSGFTTLPDSQTNPASGHISSFVVSSLDRSYVDRLPSFNIAYDLTDNLVLRAAASKVMARPSYGDIAAPGGLQYYSQEYVNEPAPDRRRRRDRLVRLGQQQGLEPYKANQFDLGLEWYFHPGSDAGVGLFRKDVSNFLLPVVQDVTQNIGGQSVVVQNYSTTASGRDAVSEGVVVYASTPSISAWVCSSTTPTTRPKRGAVTLEDGTEIGKSPLVAAPRTRPT